MKLKIPSLIMYVTLSFIYIIFPQLNSYAADVKSEFTIALDVGHSMALPGCISARGKTEFSFNLRLARELKAELNHQGYKHVFLINENGEKIDLKERPRQAAAGKANLMISIHHDSVQPAYLKKWEWQGKELRYSDQFRGYSIFYSEENPYAKDSLIFAKLLGEALYEEGLRPTLHHAEAIEGENRKLVDRKLGIYQFNELAVLRNATIPAILLEGGVLVNREEESDLENPLYRQRLIQGVVLALAKYTECDKPDHNCAPASENKIPVPI